MKTDKEKYERIIDALRKSAPGLNQYNGIEETVIRRISQKTEKDTTGIIDFLFGWIYIGWVRKSLIAASFTLLGFFLWQQHNIMHQINVLGNRISENDRLVIYNPSASLEKRQMLLKYSREIAGGYYVSEEDLTNILDSLNHLNMRYKDLLEMIDNDTLLKKKVEEKLEKELGSKIKL